MMLYTLKVKHSKRFKKVSGV